MPLGREVGLGPGHIVLDGEPVGTQRPQQPLPTFRPLSVVANWSPISATAELLLIMVAVCNRADHYIFILFLSSSFMVALCNRETIYIFVL